MSSLDDYEQGGGHVVDSNRLTAEKRAELAKLLPSRLGKKKIDSFLVAVSESVDIWKDITKGSASESDMVDQIERVESAVRRLVQALNLLERPTLETVAGHFDALVWTGEPEVDVPADLREKKPRFDEWLPEQRQNVCTLATVMHYAQGKIQPTNVPRKRRQTRDLVREIVWQYREVFDKPPGKSEWFHKFMTELGEEIKVPLGKDLINTVLSDTKNQRGRVASQRSRSNPS